MSNPQCVEPGCTKEALYYLHVKIPPLGYSVEQYGQEMDLGLAFCANHVGRVKAEDLFDEEGRKKLNLLVKTMYKSEVPLDFTRVKITPRKIGDKNWQLIAPKGNPAND